MVAVSMLYWYHDEVLLPTGPFAPASAGVHIQGFGALDLLLLHGSRGLEGIAKSTWGTLIEKEHFISGALPGHLHFKTCLS